MATVSWAALGHATREDVAAFLRDTAPVALVESIRAASDAELVAATHDAAPGSPVVEGVMSRIGEIAVPALLAQAEGRVRWESTERPGEATTLRLHGGVAEVEAAAGAGADVVVHGSDLQLLRLVAGQLDVAVAYLGNQIASRARAASRCPWPPSSPSTARLRSPECPSTSVTSTRSTSPGSSTASPPTTSGRSWRRTSGRSSSRRSSGGCRAS